jgi:hypothetical protein
MASYHSKTAAGPAESKTQLEANDNHGHGSRPRTETPAERRVAQPINQVYVSHFSGTMEPLMSPADSTTTVFPKQIYRIPAEMDRRWSLE